MIQVKLEGAFWGRRKCPKCRRKYQKDMRLIYHWDKKREKIDFSLFFCSYCFVQWYAELLKQGIEPLITWQNEKERFKNQWGWNKDRPNTAEILRAEKTLKVN